MKGRSISRLIAGRCPAGGLEAAPACRSPVAHILSTRFGGHQAQVTGRVHAFIQLAYLAHRAGHIKGQVFLQHRFVCCKLPVAGTGDGGNSLISDAGILAGLVPLPGLFFGISQTHYKTAEIFPVDELAFFQFRFRFARAPIQGWQC